MTKKVLLLFTLLITTYTLYAKDIPGKIVFKTDTLEVIFKIPVKLFTGDPDYASLQQGVKYLDSTGKKVTVLPDDAKAVLFTFKDKEICMLSRFNSIDDEVGAIISFSKRQKNIFLKLEIDGDLKLFTYFITNQGGMHMVPGPMGGAPTMVSSDPIRFKNSYYLLQQREGMLKKPKTLTFNKDMKQFLYDCPELVEDLKLGKYTKSNLKEMVEFYNNNCSRTMRAGSF